VNFYNGYSKNSNKEILLKKLEPDLEAQGFIRSYEKRRDKNSVLNVTNQKPSRSPDAVKLC